MLSDCLLNLPVLVFYNDILNVQAHAGKATTHVIIYSVKKYSHLILQIVNTDL